MNKYLSVEPVHGSPEYDVGDVVVGRIAEVQNGRWAVDIGAHRYATLHLGAINLPNNVLRRKTAEDNLQIRTYFKEDDLIVCEVQRIMQETGEVMLQTRSARYGKLWNGILAKKTV